MADLFQLDSVTVLADRIRESTVHGNRREAAPFAIGAALVILAAATVLAGVGADRPPIGDISVSTASAGTFVAALAAYLFARRLRRTHELVDVLLTATIALLAILNGLVAVSIALVGEDLSGARLIMSFGAGIVVSAGLALAAFAPVRPTADPAGKADRLLVTGVVVALTGTIATAAAVRIVTGEPSSSAIAGAELIAGLIAATATVGFARRSLGGQGPAMAWLALAAGVGGLAHTAQAAATWIGSGGASSIVLMTLGGWGALLIAGLRDMEWAQHRRAESAIQEERRRLARDLHDGLAQELAYITAESRRLAEHPNSAHLVRAAERALEESRVAIAALTRPTNEPLERLIAETAQSIAARSGVEAVVAVRPGLDAPADVRQALLRILREAMTNAIHHGRASTIHVSLDGPAPLVMAVADDGRGFDRATAGRPDSIGLLSMEERAANIGGRLTIDSTLGEGTTVAIVVP